MHKRRAAKNVSSNPIVVDSNGLSEEDTQKFELELCWCIQQLEHSLNSGKLSQKQADETTKNIKTLKSTQFPLVRKRQLMKNLFGDYRSKMKDEEKKLALATKQVKFTANNNTQVKHNFVKKAAILTSGKDFRFNFTTTTDENKTDQPITDTDAKSNSKLNLGQEFKFNFTVEEDQNINFKGLSIES